MYPNERNVSGGGCSGRVAHFSHLLPGGGKSRQLCQAFAPITTYFETVRVHSPEGRQRRNQEPVKIGNIFQSHRAFRLKMSTTSQIIFLLCGVLLTCNIGYNGQEVFPTIAHKVHPWPEAKIIISFVSSHGHSSGHVIRSSNQVPQIQTQNPADRSSAFHLSTWHTNLIRLSFL